MEAQRQALLHLRKKFPNDSRNRGSNPTSEFLAILSTGPSFANKLRVEPSLKKESRSKAAGRILNKRKVLFILLFVLAGTLLLRIFAVRSQKAAAMAVDSEGAWQKSGLTTKTVESFLNDENCNKNKIHFVACINSLIVTSEEADQNLPAIYPQLKEFWPQKRFEVERARLWTLNKKIPQITLPLKNGFSFQNAWGFISRHFSENQKAILTGAAVNAYLSVSEDPHTVIIPQKLYEDSLWSKKIGPKPSLGFFIQALEPSRILVRKIVAQSQAEKAGLKEGDIIVLANHEKIPGSNVRQMIKELKVQASKPIILSIERDGKTLELKLHPEQVPWEGTKSRIIGTSKKFGLFELRQFKQGSCQSLRKQMIKFEPQISAAVLDLRDNSGGIIEEGRCILELFLKKGSRAFSLSAKSEVGPTEVFNTEKTPVFKKPLLILVNSGTASTAELVAGSLQDHKRALLIGDRTYGKGSYQEPETWKANPKFYLLQTRGFFYLPKGNSPQLVGLTPDVYWNSFKSDPFREEQQFLFPLKAPQAARVFSKKITRKLVCRGGVKSNKWELSAAFFSQVQQKCDRVGSL